MSSILPPKRKLTQVTSKVKTLSLSSFCTAQNMETRFKLANSPTHNTSTISPVQSLTPSPERPAQNWTGQFLIQSQVPTGSISCFDLPTFDWSPNSEDYPMSGSSESDDSYDSDLDIIVSTVENSYVSAPFDVTEDQMRQEYNDIETYERTKILPSKSFSIGHSNNSKNRYSDIIPYDDNIVNVVPPGKETCFDLCNHEYRYINDSKNPKWIATQGPLYGTFNEFWRMIYENDISYIVMLGNTIEGRTQKVDQYWENLNNGPLRLKCLTIETKVETFVTGSNNSIIYREFLSGTHDPKIVKHFQYCGWPDHGIPKDCNTILTLIKTINSERKIKRLEDKPIVVHCSAGVGRTGTYCAIDMSLRKIKEAIEMYGLDKSKIGFNLYESALILRNARPKMIQQYEQYKFCYDVLKTELSNLNLK